MDYLSLFSGIGGFEYGIQQSNKAETLNCIGFSEVDKYATSIYTKHFPNHYNWGDATTINTNDLPSFDLLVGGFPCQAFSVAGHRRGFDDTRGTLFFEIARILKDKKPKYFLLENVRGLLSHDKGRTFKEILRILTNLGYTVEWQVLNSKNFGVPQNRERVYIVGHFGGRSGREVFPIGQSNTKTPIQLNKGKGQGQRVLDPKGLGVTLCGNAGGQGGKTGLYVVGNTNPSGHGQNGNVYHEYGIAPTVSTNKGQGSQILFNDSKVMVENYTEKVKVRTHEVDTEKLKTILHEAKDKKGITIKKIAFELGVEKTTVEHWFRNDNCFSIPSPNVWFKLKELLNITTDEFDESIMTFEIKDGVYDKANRCYDSKGLAPTLNATDRGLKIKENTIKGYSLANYGDGVNIGHPGGEAHRRVNKNTANTVTASKDLGMVENHRIRRLTPLECERLQAFPDSWTETGANGERISDTQRYKCVGNAVTTSVITGIFNRWELKV